MKIPKSWNKPTFTTRVIAVILVVTLPFLGFYVGYKYSFSILPLFCEQFNTPLKTLVDAEPTPGQTKIFEPGGYKIRMLFTNNYPELNLSKNGNVGHYRYGQEVGEEFGFKLNMEADIYELSEGDNKIELGYEGTTWEVDLKEEADQYKKLKEGKQLADVYDLPGGKTKTYVDVKTLRIKNWVVYDSFFKPSGNWFRHYTLFEPETNRLVNIRVAYPEINYPGAVIEAEITDGKVAWVRYPDLVEAYYQRLETELAMF